MRPSVRPSVSTISVEMVDFGLDLLRACESLPWLAGIETEGHESRSRVNAVGLSSINDRGQFLADRTIGRAYGTACRLSSVVCDVLYCGKTVRPSQKVSEGVNRKPGSKS